MTQADKIALYDDMRRQALLVGDAVIAARAWEQLHRLGAEEQPSDPAESWDDKTLTERVEDYWRV